MAKPLSANLHAVTRRAFERHGFAYADILTQWPAIIGPELAAVSMPVRLRWPRGKTDDDTAGRRRAGTLVVRVAGGRAIELQHEAPQIVERVNRYYGYEAVSGLRIVQGEIPAKATGKAPPRPLSPHEEARQCAALNGIREAPLADALQRLGAGTLRARRRSG